MSWLSARPRFVSGDGKGGSCLGFLFFFLEKHTDKVFPKKKTPGRDRVLRAVRAVTRDTAKVYRNVSFTIKP